MKSATQQFIEALRKNVDDWYADRITYEDFGAGQRSLWDEIAAAGTRVHRSVSRRVAPMAGRVG